MNAFERRAAPSDRAGGDWARMHRSLAPVLTLLVLLASACTAPPRQAGPDPASRTLALGTPQWVGQPLSWGKLEQIERWLLESGAVADPYWRLEGELELAEGRLFFARSDLGQRGVAAGRIEERLAASRAGFERVLSDPWANESQRRRALRRMGEERELDVAPPPAAAPGDLVTRAAWGARPPLPARLEPVGGPWRRVTVHHSDEVPGVTLDGTRNRSVDALRKIQGFHQEQRGWGDVGYHFLIDPDGRVFEGRPLTWQGAHAGGANNVQNLGICVLGNFQHELPTPRALASLERLLDELRRDLGIARRDVHVHRDYTHTLCPGDRLAAWVEGYTGEARAAPRAASSHIPRAAARPTASSAGRSSSGVH